MLIDLLFVGEKEDVDDAHEEHSSSFQLVLTILHIVDVVIVLCFVGFYSTFELVN